MIRVAIALSLTLVLNTQAVGEPRVKQDSKSFVTEVSRLQSDPGECLPETFSGRVVKRAFDEETGLKLTGITLEHDDGSREYVNVDVPKDLNMALLGDVTQGLQRLSKIGRAMKGSGFRCGAAGRILVLDSIR